MYFFTHQAAKTFLSLLLFLSFSASSQTPITVTNNAPYNSPAYLVQNILLGTGITASNFTYTGAPIATGFFKGVGSNLNLDSGVIMTSGKCQLAIGPNNSPSIAQINNLPGDPDLNAIMSPTLSYDASILQFDFVPMSDTVKFRYVFGSDEYMEWVSPTPGGINDGFGFFLSGPGISGPYSNNSVNIALIPNTSLPVTMFNLNLNSNGQYYFDNGNGMGTGTAPDGPHVQYDGFTHVLTARHWVQCGSTYHIKIAVGDGGDSWIDSGVFLEAGSFTAGGVVAATSSSNANINGNDSTTYEGCGSLTVYFKRSTALTQDTVNFTVGGTATPGIDYNAIGNQIIFPVGVDSIGITITAIQDNIPEPTETVKINLQQSGPCSSVNSRTITIYIMNVNPPVVTVNSPQICPGDPAVMTASVTGGMPGYKYTWSNNLGTGTSATVNPMVSTTYTVTVRDTCNNQISQTVNVNVTHPTAAFTYAYATSNSIDFTNGSSSGVVSWSWNFGDGGNSTSPSPNHTYPNSQTQTFTVTLIVTDANGCKDSVVDHVTIYPDFYFYTPNSFTPNNDHNNDVFTAKGAGIEKYEMIVFNRWGELIFRSESISQGWDGTYKGNPVEEGVYIVVFNVEGAAKQKVHRVTHCNLIR